MKCPYCGSVESKVSDSRSVEESNSIRRRRECLECGKRFTTFETVETTPVLVIKNDGSRQIFDSNKLKRGIIRACEKRPVSMAQINAIVDDIKSSKKVILIVPEQEVLRCERILAQRLDGINSLMLEVVSFRRLCNRIFREYGGLCKNYSLLNGWLNASYVDGRPNHRKRCW